jgi:hypothetical protein
MELTTTQEATLVNVKSFIEENKNIPLIKHLTKDKIISVLREFFSKDKEYFIFNNDENKKFEPHVLKNLEIINVSNLIYFRSFEQNYNLKNIHIPDDNNLWINFKSDDDIIFLMPYQELPSEYLITVLEYLLVWIK